MRKPRRQHCARCGKRYYRCNKVHLWDAQNPGHRAGWNVRDDSYCTDCTPVKTVEKILVLAAASTIAPTTHLKLVKSGHKPHQVRKRA